MYVLDQHFENYGAAFIRHDNVDFVLTPLQCGIFRDVISVVRDGSGSGKFSDFRKMAPPLWNFSKNSSVPFWYPDPSPSGTVGPLQAYILECHWRLWEGVYLLDPPKFIESSKIPFGPPTKAAVVVNFKDQGWDLDV